jgi:hypothetical protein
MRAETPVVWLGSRLTTLHEHPEDAPLDEDPPLDAPELPASLGPFKAPPPSLDAATWTVTPLELVVGEAPFVFEIARTSW